MFMSKFVLTGTPTPPTLLLSQVPRNSSSPVSKVAFSARCLLVSISPITSYLIFLACTIKSSMEASDASVRALKIPCEEKSMDLFVYYIPPDLRGIPNSLKRYQLSFVEDEGGGCSVRRVRERRGLKHISEGVRYSNETYFSASMRVFFQLTKFIEAEELAIEMICYFSG
ncbi:hypothetical protein ANCDUO_23684 [Ancylostoma duodenale]|uniref:Uncharacterized protein n=1 Tax=Ancylostoma duodenale TaxID=51022 RepID=A0A0C2FCJ4_9BILA|nr:hypothetical protein ANCDUO_23684 [Ancylostoma duodenale]